ncbi:MAG: HlyC/CorC family transporter [Lentisphaeria bacterium]|nr:HlyC/CorC family transporter [Lentisphaeria bacterium]
MQTETLTTILQSAALILLIAVSAFCSSAEMALFSLSRPKVLSYKDSPQPVRRLIWKLMDGQARTLITIIFCNMFVNSMVSMLNDALLDKMELPPAMTLTVSAFTGIVILLLLGEVTPMTVAYIYSDKWAEISARPVYYARKLLTPLTALVESFCNWILNRLGHARQDGLKPEEYLSYIENGVKRGSFTAEEAMLMKDTFALRDKTVESVMRNRSNLYFVTREDPPETVRKIIREHAQAYLPVSSERRLDSADAILSARLFFALPPEARKNWQHSPCVLDDVVFVPEATTLEKALRTLKKSRAYAAFAADEYGAVSGIITREDIYSELAGRSVELDDQTEFELLKIGPDRWMFDGMASLDLMKMALSLTIPADRFTATTLNGIFCELLGSIPRQGDSVSFGRVTLTAHAMNGNRISRMLVTLEPESPAETDGGEDEK